MYTIEYSPSAKKDLPHLSVKVKKMIQVAIEKKLKVDPISFGKPLRHNLKGFRRLRISNYRVVYSIQEQVVVVINIKNRKDIYED